MNRVKSKVIMILCITLFLMATGYAVFSTNLKITSTGNVTGTWKIYFSSISNGDANGTSAKNTVAPSVSGTTAKMSVDLKMPGDEMTYDLTITNGGNFGGVISNIDAKATGSPAIIFTMEGVKEGDKIPAGESIVMKIKIQYDPTVTSQPSETTKTLNVSIDVIQDTGQSIPGVTPDIDQPLISQLGNKILNDNIAYADNVASPFVTSSSGIDFTQPSSDTNGKGLYYTNVNTEDGKTTYYFRGDVQNNYVKFGKEHLFKIGDRFVIGVTANNDVNLVRSKEELNSPDKFICDLPTEGVAGLYDKGMEEACTSSNGIIYSGDAISDAVSMETHDLYWRIVRINEDGSVRLIYYGYYLDASNFPDIDIDIDASDRRVLSIGDYEFRYSDNAYVGYMYGLTGLTAELISPVCVTYDSTNKKAIDSTTTYTTKAACENAGGVWATNAQEATHANVVDSTIKQTIDMWYNETLSSYAKYLADAGFCNNRKTRTMSNGYGTLTTTYAASYRIGKGGNPQFVCPQTNDLFTTSSSSKGNKALTNPIGMITADEVKYAGGPSYTSNSQYYLYNGIDYWTMTPADYKGSRCSGSGIPYCIYYTNWFVGGGNGALDDNVQIYYSHPTDARPDASIIPVINLKSSVIVSSGDGTKGSPYVIKTN